MSTAIPGFLGSKTSLPSYHHRHSSTIPAPPYHHRHVQVLLFRLQCHKGQSKTKKLLSEGTTCRDVRRRRALTTAAPPPPSQQNDAVFFVPGDPQPPQNPDHKNLSLVAVTTAKVLPGRDSVVKVHCVHAEPNFSLPWQMERPFSSISSGFVIEGRRVLTNAHSVEHHTQVKLEKRGSYIKYAARVLAAGNDCDLAMLTVEDDEFWEGLSPVEFGGLPELRDAVTVMGYPVGGDTISVTSGIVSRIEMISYVGSTKLLVLQIDDAVNSGNSGGPVFNNKGNCVGMAFESLVDDDVENIGYAIPTPVIIHFIQDYEKNGEYTGFPNLEIKWQKMDNPDFRLSMGMKPDQRGVRIRKIDRMSSVHKVLKRNDVILSFDGLQIANDGTVPYINGERIDFSYLVAQKYTRDGANIEVLRKNVTLNFEITLDSRKRLILADNMVKSPSYYIVAGFVFTTDSYPYLRSEYGYNYRGKGPIKLMSKLGHNKKAPDDEIVVVSQVLEADVNYGYENDLTGTEVLAFNGEPVKNLKSLATMVESCSDEYMKFELDDKKVVVLRTETAKAATLDILATHFISSAMSKDLLRCSKKKKKKKKHGVA